MCGGWIEYINAINYQLNLGEDDFHILRTYLKTLSCVTKRLYEEIDWYYFSTLGKRILIEHTKSPNTNVLTLTDFIYDLRYCLSFVWSQRPSGIAIFLFFFCMFDVQKDQVSPNIKVKRANIRNRYNQVPHLT